MVPDANRNAKITPTILETIKFFSQQIGASTLSVATLAEMYKHKFGESFYTINHLPLDTFLTRLDNVFAVEKIDNENTLVTLKKRKRIRPFKIVKGNTPTPYLTPAYINGQCVLIPVPGDIYPQNANTIPCTEEELELDKRYYADYTHLTCVRTALARRLQEEQREQAYYERLATIPELDPSIQYRHYPTENLYYYENYRVTIVSEMSQVCEWIAKNVHECDVVGIDTEFDCVKFAYTGERAFTRSVDVITIATKQACLIIQAYKDKEPTDPKEFIDLLCDAKITKVFMGAQQDVSLIVYWLQDRYSQFSSVNRFVEHVPQDRASMGYFDLEWLEHGRGLRIKCRRYLGLNLFKNIDATFSRWSRLKLDPVQIQYAVEDALCTLLIYEAQPIKNCTVEFTKLV